MRHLTVEERARARRMDREGFSLREIARDLSWSPSGIRLVLLRDREVEPAPAPAPCFVARAGLLDAQSREEIGRGLVRGHTFAAIARHIGRRTSTVSREVERNGGRNGYRAVAAQAAAIQGARRPKLTHLETRPELADWVIARLLELWSPKQIADQLPIAFPHDPMMRVSHETIYQSLFVQGRGALRKELTACLRTGRATRRPQGRIEKRGRIPGMVMISQRPAEAADRAVPGHWEGDLIIGLNRSAIGTVVERSSRYTLLVHLPRLEGLRHHRAGQERARSGRLRGHRHERRPHHDDDHDARRTAAVADLGPRQGAVRARTVQGRHRHRRLLRRPALTLAARHEREHQRPTATVLPEGTDLSRWAHDDLLAVQAAVNSRPRKVLAWKTPAEVLDEQLQSPHQTGVATTN